jgi:hypothetical protein
MSWKTELRRGAAPDPLPALTIYNKK